MKTNCGVVGSAPARLLTALVLAGSITVTVDAQAPAAAAANSTNSPNSTNAPANDAQQSRHRQGQGRGDGGGRGWGSGMGGARGTVGTVTEAAADHYVIKTDAGELYTVHFSVNTRIMKQPAGMGPRSGGGPGGGQGSGQGGRNRDRAARADGDQDGDRPQPQPIKAAEIKVGDAITAGGELDVANKSLGAVFIMQLDPERAKELRAEEAKFGKTWLAGRITGIDGTTITIEGILDHAAHAIAVDENTSFRKRRDAITLADIKAGDQLRAEGGMKDGVFLATVVNAMNRPAGDGAPGSGGPPMPQ